MKSGNLNFLEPSGPVQACNGTDLPFLRVLLTVKEEGNIVHEVSKRKANWIGHILRKTAFYSGLLKER